MSPRRAGTALRRHRAGAALLVAACAVALLWIPPPAAQAQSDYPNQVGAQALELIHYPWQDLGWEIVFEPGRPGYLGLAIGEERRIEIFVRPEHGVPDVAHTLAHEIGHAVDITWGSDYRRAEYLRLRGFSQEAKWFGCDECSDYATPAGDFAEVFEYWLLGGGNYRSQLGGAPDAVRLQNMTHLFVEPFAPSARVFWQQRWRPSR